MNTILDAIKMYPQQFIDTCYARSQTTPSSTNKTDHLFMVHYIEREMWDFVADILKDPQYHKALKGVVLCLSQYSDIEGELWHEIVKLYEEGKIA